MQNYIFKGYRITKEQAREVERCAKIDGVSQSQLIRNLIDEL